MVGRRGTGGRGWRAACLGAALALAGGGCKRGGGPKAAPAPRIVEVRVIDRGPGGPGARGGDEDGGGEGEREKAGPLRIDADALSARALARMRGSGAVEVAPGASRRGERDYRLSLDVRLGVGEAEGETLLRAQVNARLVRIGGGLHEQPIASGAIAERTLPSGRPPKAPEVKAHVEHAVDDVIDALMALVRVHRAREKELVAALEGKDADLRREAIGVAGERKERAAVPALIAMLRSEDRELRDRALGALVEIRDPRAVKPITELSRFDEPLELPKVIDAMGALGGDEARAYLQFVVSAHDDPEMRDLARTALSHMAP